MGVEVHRARAGSSPLARGARARFLRWYFRAGLIPAGAGSTRFDGVCCLVSGAHPRWRGEHWFKAIDLEGANGSSPLARGAHPSVLRYVCFLGLIPAGAGSTARLPRLRPARAAHPRWRGEHCLVVCVLCHFFGSSPLARGAPGLLRVSRLRRRLIPAGAGSTNPSHIFMNSADGSSPLARGAHWMTSGYSSLNAILASTCTKQDPLRPTGPRTSASIVEPYSSPSCALLSHYRFCAS